MPRRNRVRKRRRGQSSWLFRDEASRLARKGLSPHLLASRMGVSEERASELIRDARPGWGG